MDVNKLQKPKIHSGGLGEVYYNSFEDLKNAFDNSKGSEVDKTKYFKKVFIYDALKVDGFNKIYRFENNTGLNKVSYFLNETAADIINKIKYKEIIQELNLFESYLNDLENRILEPQQTDQPQQEAKKPIISDLKSLFTDIDKYTEVMQILADNGYIYKETGYWIDKDKGYKSFLASLLKKHLYAKRYLKRNPNNNEVVLICKNTFGVELGIDTVKTADVNITQYNFIPSNGT